MMYTPLPSFLFIKSDTSQKKYDVYPWIKRHSYGLFTNLTLPPNTNLGVSHVYHDWFDDGWIRTPLGGFYKHSETPNCELRDSTMDEGFLTGVKLLCTLDKEIQAGQELTCRFTIHLESI